MRANDLKRQAWASLVVIGQLGVLDASRRVGICEKTGKRWAKSGWFAEMREGLTSGDVEPLSAEDYEAKTRARKEKIFQACDLAINRAVTMLQLAESGEMPISAKNLADITKSLLQAQEAHRNETGEVQREREAIARAGKSDMNVELNFENFYHGLTGDQRIKIAETVTEPIPIEGSNFEVLPD